MKKNRSSQIAFGVEAVRLSLWPDHVPIVIVVLPSITVAEVVQSGHRRQVGKDDFFASARCQLRRHAVARPLDIAYRVQ